MISVIVYDSICLHFGKVSADMERYGKTTANATEDRWFIEDLVCNVRLTSKRHQVLRELASTRAC